MWISTLKSIKSSIPELSLEGCVINDSHSEIVSRRGFILYLYKQIELAQEDEDKSVLTRGQDGKFKLKDGMSFHLFITTAPCGDARIFSLHESSTSTNPEAAKKPELLEEINNNQVEPSEALEVSSDANNNAASTSEVEENFGNESIAIFVTKAEEVEKLLKVSLI